MYNPVNDIFIIFFSIQPTRTFNIITVKTVSINDWQLFEISKGFTQQTS